MNRILTGHAIEQTTSHIFSEKELINSAGEKVNENAVEMYEEQLWEVE